MTTLRYTHQYLIATNTNAEKTAKVLGITVQPKQAKKAEVKPVRKDQRLYGIGRRSPAFIERA